MKTLLVTGGCGFIGSHFIRLVLTRTEWRVVNVDALTYAGDPGRLAGVEEGQRYRFVRADIADARAVSRILTEERPWAVVNFAAESHVDRSILDAAPFLRTNLLGVQALLDGVRQSDVERFVQVSTDEVYGDAGTGPPCDEDSPLKPSSPYAASKAAADLLCLAYLRTYRVPVVIARSSNNYGPFQYPEKLIPLVIRNALVGEDIPLYGDGRQRRDWLFVEDNCRALLAVLQQGALGAVYNIASGTSRENLEVVRAVCTALADELQQAPEVFLSRIRFTRDRPGHDRAYAMACHRIIRDLGWTPEVSFEDGLRRTVRWYITHREWLSRVDSDTYRAYYEAVYRRGWGGS